MPSPLYMKPWLTPTLVGTHVRLEPLELQHAEGLRAAAFDGELWRLPYTTVPGINPGDAEEYIEHALIGQASGKSMPMVVWRRNADGSETIVGTTRFYDADRSVPRVKIGFTWYAKSAQRTAVNTECKLLLLGHAFERWLCEAVVIETSHVNKTSQAAIQRLGAKLDGVLRAHLRHPDGSLRDTHVYSILEDEWPDVKAHLRARLDAHAHA